MSRGFRPRRCNAVPSGSHRAPGVFCVVWFVKGEFEALVGLQALPKVQEFIFQGRYLNKEFEYGFYLVGTDEYLKAFEDVGVKLGFI
jgi:hypothetical protein